MSIPLMLGMRQLLRLVRLPERPNLLGLFDPSGLLELPGLIDRPAAFGLPDLLDLLGATQSIRSARSIRSEGSEGGGSPVVISNRRKWFQICPTKK